MFRPGEDIVLFFHMLGCDWIFCRNRKWIIIIPGCSGSGIRGYCQWPRRGLRNYLADGEGGHTRRIGEAEMGGAGGSVVDVAILADSLERL